MIDWRFFFIYVPFFPEFVNMRSVKSQANGLTLFFFINSLIFQYDIVGDRYVHEFTGQSVPLINRMIGIIEFISDDNDNK